MMKICLKFEFLVTSNHFMCPYLDMDAKGIYKENKLLHLHIKNYKYWALLLVLAR